MSDCCTLVPAVMWPFPSAVPDVAVHGAELCCHVMFFSHCRPPLSVGRAVWILISVTKRDQQNLDHSE